MVLGMPMAMLERHRGCCACIGRRRRL